MNCYLFSCLDMHGSTISVIESMLDHALGLKLGGLLFYVVPFDGKCGELQH